MPPTLSVAPGLRAWTITLENGQVRNMAASSVDSAVSGVWPSPVVSATRGAPPDATAPAPVITSLVPTSAKVGDANFTLHVHGTGFGPGCVIVWNGGVEPTTVVGPTELTTGVNMATATTPTAIPITVRSLLGLDSNVSTFNILPAAIE
jgi:hypothetical protein